jgi:uncharacterized protein (UPF0264 family)
VDAKDPASSSSIGAVSPAVLDAIRDAVPPATRMSAALGDVRTVDDVARAFAGVTVPLAYVKLGFRAVAETALVASLLAEAVDRAARLPSRPGSVRCRPSSSRRWCIALVPLESCSIPRERMVARPFSSFRPRSSTPSACGVRRMS